MKQSTFQKKRTSAPVGVEDQPGLDERPFPTPWKAVHTAISNLLRQALAELQANPQEQALHEFRKAVKRIRAIIRMVRSGTDAPKNESLSALGVRKKTLGRLDALLHSLSQSSTQVRDLYVQIRLLARMRRKMKDPVEASLCRFLEERCRLQLYLLSPVKPKVMHGIATALETLPDSPRTHLALTSLDRALKQAETKERKAKKKASSHPQTDRLHAWRKRAKTLWYMTEFLHENGFPLQDHSHACPKKLKKLTDLLGKDRDLALLGQSLDQVRSKGKKRLKERITKRRSCLQKKIFAK